MAMASMAAVGWRWWCVLVVLCQHGDRLRERHTPLERTPSLSRMNHPKTAQLFGHVERGGSRPTGRTFSAEKHGLKYGPCHCRHPTQRRRFLQHHASRRGAPLS